MTSRSEKKRIAELTGWSPGDLEDHLSGPKPTSHTGRKHARLAPSAADRWWECPGSVRASGGTSDRGSVYADEGTAAHELAQHCSVTGFDAGRFAGMFVNLDMAEPALKFCAAVHKDYAGGRVFEVTDEMVDGVQEYLDFTRELAAAPGAEVSYEEHVDLSWIGIEGLDGGTGDFVCYTPATMTLDLTDFKYGRGVIVEPEDNKQLLCYALGAARRWLNRGLARVRLTVVQPRAPHPAGSIRTWEAEPLDIFDFEDELRVRAVATLDPNAPLKPGPWCKFCPVGATCTARRDYVLTLAQAEFDVFDNLELPVVTDMPPQDIAKFLRHADQIEDWCRRVKEHAHAEAVEGRIPPGFKLVAKRATRRWRDEDAALIWLGGSFNIALRDLVTSRMKSPAQVEPLLPGKNKKERARLLEGAVVKESSGTVLAPEEDARPAVQSGADEFEKIYDEAVLRHLELKS